MAAGPVHIEVRDLDRLRRALRAVERDLPRRIVPGALKAATERVYLQQARDETPVRSGTLRGTIRVLATQQRVRLAAGYKRVPYAGPIHFGWRAHNIAANPFLERAAARGDANRAVLEIQREVAARMNALGVSV